MPFTTKAFLCYTHSTICDLTSVRSRHLVPWISATCHTLCKMSFRDYLHGNRQPAHPPSSFRVQNTLIISLYRPWSSWKAFLKRRGRKKDNSWKVSIKSWANSPKEFWSARWVVKAIRLRRKKDSQSCTDLASPFGRTQEPSVTTLYHPQYLRHFTTAVTTRVLRISAPFAQARLRRARTSSEHDRPSGKAGCTSTENSARSIPWW